MEIRKCSNCGKIIGEGDKYCRICGTDTKSSKPYRPEKEGPAQCIYGPPPVPRVHKCTKCGYTWETDLMIDNEQYCPMCGGPADVRERF